MQNITKLTQTVDDLSPTDCGATFWRALYTSTVLLHYKRHWKEEPVLNLAQYLVPVALSPRIVKSENQSFDQSIYLHQTTLIQST